MYTTIVKLNWTWVWVGRRGDYYHQRSRDESDWSMICFDDMDGVDDDVLGGFHFVKNFNGKSG